MKAISTNVAALGQIRMRSQNVLANVPLDVDQKKSGKRQGEDGPQNIPVNSISWNPASKFQHQYMTADEAGYVTLWDALRGKPLA